MQTCLQVNKHFLSTSTLASTLELESIRNSIFGITVAVPKQKSFTPLRSWTINTKQQEHNGRKWQELLPSTLKTARRKILYLVQSKLNYNREIIYFNNT